MAYSFKKIRNKSEKKKTDYSLFIMIFFIIVVIVCITLSIVMGNKNSLDEESSKQKKSYVVKNDKSKDYIYTVKEEENKTQEETTNKVPAINIKSDKYDELNEKILNIYEQVKTKSEYDYQYKYNKSGNILSLLVQYGYSPAENSYPITFYNSYNIDLTTGELLSSDELLSRYDVTKEELKSFVEAKFQGYYKDLVEKKYYTKQECDYTCFLKNRGISTDYLKGTSLYVDKSSLTLFKFYYKDSKYNEENYFGKISYQLVVKK